MDNLVNIGLPDLKSPSTFRVNMSAVAKGGGYVFTGKLFLDVVRFVTAILLARLLGAEQYGMYSLSLSAMNIAVGVALLGLDAALLRFVAVMIGRKDEEAVWGTIQVGVGIALLLSVASGVILYGSSYVIAERAFNNINLAPMLQLASVFIPVLTMSELLASVIKGFKRMDYPVIAQFVFQPLVRLVLIVILALSGFSAFWAIVTYGAADLLASLLLLHYLNREFRLRRPINPARRDFKSMLGFSMPVWLSGLMVKFQGNIQAIVLGALNTIASVGVFSIASQITMVSGHFTSSLNTSSKPIIAQLYDQRDWKQMEKIYQTTNKWAVMVQLPLFLLIVFFPAILLSIFGESYTQGANALVILAVADLLNVSTGMGGVILDMTGNTRLKLLNSLVRLGLYLGFDLFFIPRWGLMGAALGVLAGEGVVNLLRLIQVYILFKILPFNRGFFKPIIAALCAAGAVLALGYWLPIQANWWNAIIGATLLGSVYAGVTFLMGFSEEEMFMLDGLRNQALKFTAKLKRPAA
jgi:O-antigen/teichoic acid export membrane protein